MKYTAVIFLFILLLSCSKDDAPIPPSGIWVEQSLRLDTLDFEKENSQKIQSLFLTAKPPGFNIPFEYYFKGDSLFLHSSLLSSCMCFSSYKFQMAPSLQTFEVANFYHRNGLPATLTFEKIK